MIQVDSSYLNDDLALAKSWFSECWRVFCDRMTDTLDKKTLFAKLNEIARRHFKIGGSVITNKIGQPFFCTFNQGSDNLYLEIEDLDKTTKNLQKILQEYNEVNKSGKMDIVLFEFMTEYLAKIQRLIRQP